MRFLPQANPLYQHVATENIKLPDVLEKLGKGGFTGYLSHIAESFEAYAIFAKGKLICALSSETGKDKTGFEAVVRMFEISLSKKGEINAYRMTADLALCANALAVGKKLHDGDDVRQVDIKGLLSRIKHDEINGVVKFYTEQNYAMMFYRAGQPTGFYHDSANAIETTPDHARRIASLPGARLAVFTTSSLDELLRYDLLQMVNLQKLWESACSRQSSQLKVFSPPEQTTSIVDDAKLSEIVDDLKEIAMAYLARPGGDLVLSLLEKLGGSKILLDSNKFATFLKQMEESAKVFDPDAKLNEMIELMQSEVTGRLSI